MINWFYRLKKGSQFAVGTLAVHLLLIIFLTGQHLISSSPKKQRPITINTIRIAATPAPIVQAPTASKPNVKPALQPKPVSPKPIKASKSIESKKGPAKQEMAILKEIEKNIVSIAAPKPIKKTELAIPSLGAPEEILESPVEKLAQFLQQALQLPEFGAVRVQLSVDRSGKLQSFEVIDAKSEKNGQFLKNKLPELQFPCLNEAVSLTIVFSNEL